jgi:hypothetical protein
VKLDRPKSSRERFVYVIEFTSGTVKVGQTANPQGRLHSHKQGARAHGHAIARSWVSAPHVNYDANEQALIAFCSARWSTSSGHEYFANANFDQVVEHAHALPFRRLTAEEEARLDTQGKEHADAFIAALKAGLGKPDTGSGTIEHQQVMDQLGTIREKVELIALLVNDENRSAACDAFYELAKQATALTPPEWADEDPTAAERYLISKGTPPERARRTAAEFELNFRTLFVMEFLREAESFEDIARFCDEATADPAQQRLAGGAA